MRSSPSTGRRLPLAALGGILALTASVTASPAAADHTSFPTRVTLMGSLQNELGCTADWDTACTATDLTAVPSTDAFELVKDVPAGTYEFKVRLNGSWDESYGLDGTDDDAPLVLPTATRLRFRYDGETHRLTVTPAAAPAATDPVDRSLAQESLREDLTRERFYFVMADRFENGNPANDRGGLAGDRTRTGFDPTARGWYHGGDLKGILDRLDYIENLGTTAIWLTPSFKNKPVQGEGENQSAGYHGYWITDFTQIDPHLGTNEELEQLIDEAHDRGMKVFFDIITNHTADVISYEEGTSDYVYKVDQPNQAGERVEPYKDAAGTPFDDRDYAGTEDFPALDPEASFPYTPVFQTEADETVKFPTWLNDPTLYHNRGNAKFDGGESDEYGDFFGLDDLFTEHPAVVKGMEDIYKAWVDFGIDGFRIDTVKHVNMEFWQAFAPAIEQHAADNGNPDFFSFGEVFDTNPVKTSSYTTEGKLQATLDFGFQNAASQFAQGRPASVLQRFFATDDWYTDADSNAYSLPTFLGNHDMGRIGYFLKQAKLTGDDALDRAQLAHTLMYLTRGQPVVYYGDEQGFVGDGGDQLARQDMFPSKVAEYNDDDLIGTSATTAQSNFNTTHPLYRHLRELSQLRERHPTLADGAQINRYADDAAGVYAFSRIADADDVEYVVAVNNSTQEQTVAVDTFSAANRPFRGVWPLGTRPLRTNAQGQLQVTVPALSAVVHRANQAVARVTGAAPKPEFTALAGSTVGGRSEVAVTVPGGGFNQVTFAYRPVGTRTWTTLGTDDNAPYRVFHDVRSLPKGTLLEYRAVVKDHSGNRAAAGTYAITGTPPVVEREIPDPTTVTAAGTFNSEVGCEGDWLPACEQAMLEKDPLTGLWTDTFDLPAGTWEFKIAYDGAWDNNFGADGVFNGGNISLTTTGGDVTFTYDPKTHLVTTTEG